MCGEHASSATGAVATTGSSPHVRGAHADVDCRGHGFGIIPACAGSTRDHDQRGRIVRDHPRMCGEHVAVERADGLVQGSSPHVRGARRSNRSMSGRPGIIPACAGSTTTQDTLTDQPRDHPRMCGEHRFYRLCRLASEGSSPHVRGAPHARDCPRRRPGIIPACAGSTKKVRSVYHVRRDHPRMCGEHRICDGAPQVRTGSSPHVRGAQVPPLQGFLPLGIIPACAGSTRKKKKQEEPKRDHPRMCGEHTSKIA